jgi:hypothetical protein
MWPERVRAAAHREVARPRSRRSPPPQPDEVPVRAVALIALAPGRAAPRLTRLSA